MKLGLAGIGLLVAAVAAFAQENIGAPPTGLENVTPSVIPERSGHGPWGQFINPDRDCAFRMEGNSVTLAVPGAEQPHDFAPELRILNAPRVLQKTNGDFCIEVEIAGSFTPGEESTLPGRTGYTGAGLVLIADSQNCVTLARATLQHPGGAPQGYINFEMRENGELTRMGSILDRPVTSDAPIHLRLERRGKQILGAVSEDGTKWEELPPKQLSDAWPEKAEAGIIAISTSKQPFEPKYSALKFTPPPAADTAPATVSEPSETVAPAPQAKGDMLDLARVRQQLPEQIIPLSDEHLAAKVPNFYYFEYDGYPQPGKRYWIRVNRDTWVERYPDGYESTFKVLGHAKVADTEGTMVVKVTGSPEETTTTNDGGLQAFIPDKGSEVMHHWYRNSSRGDTQWNDIGPMEGVQ